MRGNSRKWNSVVNKACAYSLFFHRFFVSSRSDMEYHMFKMENSKHYEQNNTYR